MRAIEDRSSPDLGHKLIGTMYSRIFTLLQPVQRIFKPKIASHAVPVGKCESSRLEAVYCRMCATASGGGTRRGGCRQRQQQRRVQQRATHDSMNRTAGALLDIQPYSTERTSTCVLTAHHSHNYLSSSTHSEPPSRSTVSNFTPKEYPKNRATM